MDLLVGLKKILEAIKKGIVAIMRELMVKISSILNSLKRGRV